MIRFSALESLGVSVAAMSDRSDGDCRLPAASNDFAGLDGRCKFLAGLGLDANALVAVRQVHGIEVVFAASGDRGKGGLDAAAAPAEADAIITAEPGVPIGISVADCVPLLVFDAVARVAAVGHAGRLGTMGNIAGAIVDKMGARFGSKPGNIHAVIGPSAGPDRYEVSEEIAESFSALGLPRNGRMLDLWGANRQQFEDAGVPLAQIQVTGHCTISDGRYYSHRADGGGGRNLAVLCL